MKKRLTKSCIIGYLLMLAVASLGIFTATYARYVSQAEETGTVSVAVWGAGATLEALSIDVSDLTPGTQKTYSFQVTNTKDGKTSQVAQAYTFTIETTENLPLVFSLSSTGSVPEGSGTAMAVPGGALVFQDGKAELDGGSLPHTVPVTHKYELSVSWPDDEDARLSDYADEIDLVTLTVKADQMIPTS